MNYRLIEARAACRFSLLEIAYIIGCAPVMITAFEAGERTPRESVKKAFSTLYGIPETELFSA